MVKPPPEQFEVELFFIAERPNSICVAIDDDEASPEVWLPKTWKGVDLAWTKKGANIRLFAPEDLLIEKGLV